MKKTTDNLKKHVEYLSKIFPPRNYLNQGSIDKTINYISNEFKSYGYAIEAQEFTSNKKDKIHKNISVIYGDKDKRRLIIGAHYDVCMDTPGADDNASAIAGLLENAREIMLNKPDLDYCIEFVAFANEEPPFFGTEYMGSYIHAKSLKENKTNVIGMICYEMIGYYSEKENSQNIPDEFNDILKYKSELKLASFTPKNALKKLLDVQGINKYVSDIILKNKKDLYEIVQGIDMPSIGNFIIVLSEPKNKKFCRTIVEKMNEMKLINTHQVILPKEIGFTELSDHMNYWKFGFDAVMINDTSFLRNPNYHKITDTHDTLNYSKMTDVVYSVYNAIIHF